MIVRSLRHVLPIKSTCQQNWCINRNRELIITGLRGKQSSIYQYFYTL